MNIIPVVQGSSEWRQLRLCKVSGTKLADAIGTNLKQQDLINTLIAEELTGEGKETFASQAMLLGTEAESYAVSEYEQMTGQLTEEIGICQSDEFEWLINSPDRLILQDGKYKKAVEVKSPNPETAIKYIRNGGIPKEYHAQVLSYFIVNPELEELDFIVYSPKIQTERYRLWIKNIKRNEISEDIDNAIEKLHSFREKWVEALQSLNLSL